MVLCTLCVCDSEKMKGVLPSVHGLGLSGSLGYSIRGREDESNFKPEMQCWETYASEHPRCARGKTPKVMTRVANSDKFFRDESDISASQETI